MSQNLINLDLSAGQLASLDETLMALEANLAGLIALTPEQRRDLTKMGDKSEAFCRQAVDVFRQHPDVLPRNFDLDGFTRDLAALDALRPRLLRIQRVLQRCQDTEMALDSD